ncbi:MAG: zonular occludens toxin domain-containing protein [Paenalcaligenes sp.]
MPITVYTGLMGSGKSYECVSSAIIPAVKEGRRIVTNIDGIDNDAIRAYCKEKFKIPLKDLGHIIHCSNDDVCKANFLPYGETQDTFCQSGDIICIDEAWRFWGPDSRLLDEHKIFFREHRHYVHSETKVCCDLVLMVQDISDLNRQLKVVVEVTFRTTKIKTLGLNKTYRVEMWEGYKLTQKGRVSIQNKRYAPDIFPLYSSYSGGVGRELLVDDRQNVLKSPVLWVKAILYIGLVSVSLYFAISFFGSSRLNSAPQVDQPLSITPKTQASSSLPVPRPSTLSPSWRVAGSVQIKGQQFVLVQIPDGRIRLEHPSQFQNSGILTVGEIDGERITPWSGNKPSSKGQK